MNKPFSAPESLWRAPLHVNAPQVSQERLPTLTEYVKKALSRKWLILALTALVAILTTLIVDELTPIFRTKSVLLVENLKPQITSIEQLYSGTTAGREFMQTQIGFIQSREIADRVIDKLNLGENRLFDPRQQHDGMIRSILGQIPGLGSLLAKPRPTLTDDQVAEHVYARFKQGLVVLPSRQSQLLEIQVESADPNLAAAISNTVAAEYIQADLEARFEMQTQATRFLHDRLAVLQTNLQDSEQSLQRLREEMGVVSTPEGSKGGTVRQLDSTGERLVQAGLELAQAAQIYQQVKPGAPGRYEVPEVFNNPAVVSARAEAVKAQSRFTEISTSLGASHPEYQKAAAELKAARRNVATQSEGVISSIEKRYEVARSTQAAMAQAIETSRDNIQEYTRKEANLTVLERLVATNQTIYDTFLKRVKETDATADFRSPIARIVDHAKTPTQPAKPQKLQIILASVVVGGVLASILAVTIEMGAVTIRSTDEVEEKLQVPLVAATPKVRRLDPMTVPPRSPFAESIRTAVTGVNLVCMDSSCCVVGITSSSPSEGKSTVAVCYALEQARTRKTLLIEADLRKPAVADRLGQQTPQLGTQELLEGAELEKCVITLPSKLDVILASGTSTSPIDLFMTPRFASVLAGLREKYEAIIIDTPPMELVADALPIGLQCSGMIFVLRSGITPIPMAKRNIRRLQSANVDVLGVLLNAHDFARANRYYGEHSAYGKYEGHYQKDA